MSANENTNDVVSTLRSKTPEMENNSDVESALAESMQKFTTPTQGQPSKQGSGAKRAKTPFSLMGASQSKGQDRKPSTEQRTNTGVTNLARPDTHQGTNEGKITNATKRGGSYVVGGRLIGAGANEPDWSEEDLQTFAARRSTKIKIVSVTDSRKSVADKEQKYVKKNTDGSISATSASVHPAIGVDEYILGLGQSKPDERLKQRMYSDVVMVGKNRDWVLTQWVVDGAVMEPVPASVRAGAKKGNRTIGVNFARFGFPVSVFGPVFGSLSNSMKGLMDDITSTDGFYWINAAWGVNNNSATFAYKTDNGSTATLNSLNDAMDMLGTKSSMCMATFAISVACDYTRKDGKIIADMNKYVFSIKCHNVFHLKSTDWHGPPQVASVGYSVTNDLLSKAESLSKPAVMDKLLGESSGLFGDIGTNPFTSMSMNEQRPLGSSMNSNTGGGLL